MDMLSRQVQPQPEHQQPMVHKFLCQRRLQLKDVQMNSTSSSLRIVSIETELRKVHSGSRTTSRAAKLQRRLNSTTQHPSCHQIHRRTHQRLPANHCDTRHLESRPSSSSQQTICRHQQNSFYPCNISMGLGRDAAPQLRYKEFTREPNQRTILVAIDLSKALDTVSQGMLLQQLMQSLPSHVKKWANLRRGSRSRYWRAKKRVHQFNSYVKNLHSPSRTLPTRNNLVRMCKSLDCLIDKSPVPTCNNHKIQEVTIIDSLLTFNWPHGRNIRNRMQGMGRRQGDSSNHIQSHCTTITYGTISSEPSFNQP